MGSQLDICVLNEEMLCVLYIQITLLGCQCMVLSCLFYLQKNIKAINSKCSSVAKGIICNFITVKFVYVQIIQKFSMKKNL